MSSVKNRRASIEQETDLPTVDSENEDDSDHRFQLYEEATRAEQLIRNAFMVALFHFFERQCVSAMKGSRFDHERAMSWLEQQGYSPDRKQLRTLELCVHCTKHGPGSSCDRLFALEPALFSLVHVAGKTLRPDGDRMKIPPERIEQFFEAVSKAMWRPPEPRRPSSPRKSATIRAPRTTGCDRRDPGLSGESG
jgi:hypothetical protein